MATLVLQTAGAAFGSFLGGPVGASVGRAAGALAGNAIDRSLFGEDQLSQGSRLTDLTVQEAREGTPIPRIFGRARLTGQVIWATNFEEVVTDEEQGGKGGGPTVTQRTFSYFGNFAVAVCEGEISHIARIWVDGDLLDTEAVTMRIYKGDEEQAPDGLITAKQGENGAPAYRGVAYVVFERLPLEPFGNRLPQLSFEVVRSIGRLEPKITAIQLIPGASEFIYDTENILERGFQNQFRSQTRHIQHAATDLEASLDELQALCPNLGHVALVSSWFGDDLRCGSCTIRPRVEVPFRSISAGDWRVNNIARHQAGLVSQIDGAPAFGGTPSDAGVIRTIRNLKARGIKVTYNPFIMMDVPVENTLPDPYSDAGAQPVYPWRGRITASRAPGRKNTTDKTDNVREEITAFLGNATPASFSVHGTVISFSGGDDFGFRRFVLHAAFLCKAAGGVDTFIIASEMRGLTWLRDGNGGHPFVDALIDLSDDVRTILGPDTEITYGADWSEYFGYQPSDGSGDVDFHLDPLWAHENINAIGIDNYMPLADWRDGDRHLDASISSSIYDPDYLKGNIAGGEGFDWFYANFEDRQNQIRTPITDGGAGKPWVFRYKDLINWWSNQHFNRPGGIEVSGSTAWQPQSKPIIFTEFGMPAIDKAANQPNVFFDPQSSESAVPYFSSAVRDDAAQRAGLTAALDYWQDPLNNPNSPVYGGPMVRFDQIYVWTWDARPYPAFPHQTETWSDSENWRFGHWLNGRLGNAPLADLIADVVRSNTGLDIDTVDVQSVVDGYVISDRTSARNALEILLEAFQIDIIERNGVLVANPRQRRANLTLDRLSYARVDQRAEQVRQREQEAILPSVLAVSYQDIDVDFQPVTCSSRRLVGETRRTRDIQIPLVTSYDRILPVIEQWLQALWLERDRISFALSQTRLDIEVGDVVKIQDPVADRLVVVSRIEDGLERRVQTRIVAGLNRSSGAANATARAISGRAPLTAGPPLAEVLDLPLLSGQEIPHAPRIAATATPWPGGAPVFITSATTGFSLRQTIERPAIFGTLLSALESGPIGVFDFGNELEIALSGGLLSGVDDLLLFSGNNALAIRSAAGLWEVLQFSNAELIGGNRWRLSRLLRAQAGTEDAMAAGYEPGARIVILNRAVQDLDITRIEAERSLNLKVGLSGRELTDQFTTQFSAQPQRRGLRPLSPVHLTARRERPGGIISLSWIRRTRIDGDLWEVPDVPLGEETEQYEVAIFSGDDERRRFTVGSAEVAYSLEEQQADFGVFPDQFSFSVAQVSTLEGAGGISRRTVTF